MSRYTMGDNSGRKWRGNEYLYPNELSSKEKANIILTVIVVGLVVLLIL